MMRTFRDRLRGAMPGQQEAADQLAPYIDVALSGLAPARRPAGVFLLLGPTGSGKTFSVESIAELLHGDRRKALRVDCGEYALEYETAKLIGSPPGYLGHRETPAVLTREALSSRTSQDCKYSVILFDEIEKGSRMLYNLLLGILDRAELRLGDNAVVNFEKTLLFFTSNLGARDRIREARGYGFSKPPREGDALDSVVMGAVRRRFSPEFINRIDATIHYRALTRTAFEGMLDRMLEDMQAHIAARLGPSRFTVQLTPAARVYLLDKGCSAEFGARELRRVLDREVWQPLAERVLGGTVAPMSELFITVRRGALEISDRGRGLKAA